ncbi:hypothetical protein QE429_002671 [Bacillus sp. SORGH_AS 510]|uniref:hypothetical protein n=1 Tax=Bacillus sp. SORGH_AS_0510 TaxID=3041771 RepID=UPI002781EC8C|nr:hypothetical protein [Bacillus sp. SORGH_AS_0510]MDQ1145844.1 hypothetical protein [Bacillus sp. SORGH_AS_0510]
MKKLLTLLFGGLIALSLFVTTGNTAKAAENDCGCTPVVGAEKNIIVADLISSQNFKTAKAMLTTAGYSFKGVSLIEVAKNKDKEDPEKTVTIVVVPFYTSDGQVIIAGFVKGEFQGAVNPATREPVLLPQGKVIQIQSILSFF